jgi:CRP-like cAMP-binding protein
VPEHEFAVLSSVDLFAPLPVTTLEKLASRLHPAVAGAGTTIVKQGDHGDRFYLVEKGEVDVVHDGRPVATLQPGQFFGEIALLQDVPRVASVTARTDVSLLVLEREEFISAVAGHMRSEATAEDVMGVRLAELEKL